MATVRRCCVDISSLGMGGAQSFIAEAVWRALRCHHCGLRSADVHPPGIHRDLRWKGICFLFVVWSHALTTSSNSRLPASASHSPRKVIPHLRLKPVKDGCVETPLETPPSSGRIPSHTGELPSPKSASEVSLFLDWYPRLSRQRELISGHSC